MDDIANITDKQFAEVYGIINLHRQRCATTINNESLSMIWEVGGYVSAKLKSSQWGDNVVRQLSEYIRNQDSKIRGWSYRTIYKMVQFYDTYSSDQFARLLAQNPLSQQEEFVPIESAQIVSFEIIQIPNILYSIGWANHQTILNRCNTYEEKLFYILYASREKLMNKELERVIKAHTMENLLSNGNFQTAKLKETYPNSQVMFKDLAYIDFLGLPQKYKETKLRKGIVSRLKDFILEVGKDFLFIDEEHRISVGGKTFKIDLLFYHRQLQCMVAFELKTTEFKPAYLGQLEFYLEALDQEERRSKENPTIGILFCKESDQEVVRFALNRSMSPLMIMQYKEQLKIGSVIQRSLVEYCKYISEED